jgi:hypothetical protein
VICHPRRELITHYLFLELSNLDVPHPALEAMHLVAKARRWDWQNGDMSSPFLMELFAPKQSCLARSEKTGASEETVSEDFHGLFTNQDLRITGWRAEVRPRMLPTCY